MLDRHGWRVAIWAWSRGLNRPGLKVVTGALPVRLRAARDHHAHQAVRPATGGAGMSDRFDVIVVGAGPAGEHAAGRLADGGLSVASWSAS